MISYKNPSIPFLLFLFLFFTLKTEASIFKIVNRKYGALPAATISYADALFDDFETQVNTKMPSTSSTDTYLAGIANATVMSSEGTGVDYSTPFHIITVGPSAGLGLAIGTLKMNDILQHPKNLDFKQVAGFGTQASLTVGSNAGLLFKEPWFHGWVDPKRLNGYLSFFTASLKQKDVDISFTSFSLLGQYSLIKERKAAWGVVKWGGVQVTSGLRYTGMKLGFSKPLAESKTENIPQLGGDVTLNLEGIANIGVDTSVYTIPVEISTYTRLFYILPIFVGMGTDLSYGSATGTASVTGSISVSGAGITAEPSLDIGNNARPSWADFRYFVGTGLELGVIGLYAQFNQNLINDTIGVSVNMRAFW